MNKPKIKTLVVVHVRGGSVCKVKASGLKTMLDVKIVDHDIQESTTNKNDGVSVFRFYPKKP